MAMIAGVGLFFLRIVAAALSRLVGAEIDAWIPSITRGLIKMGVGRLPEKHRGRFAEEWQSHINEVPGVVAKVFAAAGCLLAAHKIAWCSNEAEDWLQTIARIQQARSKVLMVVSAVRGDQSLASHEPLQSKVERLSLLLSESQSEEQLQFNQLVEAISAYSAVPATFFSRVRYWRELRSIRKGFAQMSLRAKEASELSDRIITLLETGKSSKQPRRSEAHQDG